MTQCIYVIGCEGSIKKFIKLSGNKSILSDKANKWMVFYRWPIVTNRLSCKVAELFSLND